MKNKNIYIISANPQKGSLTEAIAMAYNSGCLEGGAETKYINILDMEFDPVLHFGYTKIQPLEKDLLLFQENIKWADKVVFIYPNWWSTMPAKMKGLFDRAFLPGFAFKMINHKCVPLFTEKSARILNISGSYNPIFLFLKMGSYTNELSKGILKETGFKNIKINYFGPTRNASLKKRNKWIKKAHQLGVLDSC